MMIVMGLILCLIHCDEYMVGIKIFKPLFMLFVIYMAPQLNQSHHYQHTLVE